MQLRRTISLLAAASLVVAACSSGDDDAEAPVDSSAEEPAEEPAADPTTPPTEPTEPTTPATEPTTPATEPTTPPTEPPAPTAPSSTSLPALPFEPVGPAPYDVGVSTITVGEGTDRPLTVDVWYPIGDASGLDLHQYTLLPGTYYESPTAFSATPDLIVPDGPFPLVVYSHGSGGLRYIHSSYTEALAGFGYVVAAPDHTGNTALERIAGTSAPGEETAFNRPNDVARVLDAFTGDGDAAAPWVAHVDADRVAVTGHSFGGFTSIAMVTGFGNELGTFDIDDRVDAIIPLAPATGATLLPDELLGTVDVPMLVLVGTDDVTTPVDPNVTRLWDLNDNSPAYRVELVAGEHQTFTDLCAYRRFLPALPDVPQVVIDTIESFGEEGCSPGDMDDLRAAELTNTYAVLFLDQVFQGGDPIESEPPSDVIFQAR